MSSAREIARWRLRSQHLTGTPATSARAVLERLLAVQAENVGQAGWAVACRTASPDASALARLVDEGAVVRTHVLRPTWHWVAAEDAGWLLELTAPRVRPSVLRQLTHDHGWTGVDVDRTTTAVLDVLTERPDRTREEVAHGLRGRGLAVAGHPLALVLALAELDRAVCSGRWVEGAHTYAPYADRVGPVRRLERDEALAELAVRYLTGHGPATERDLAYWATLPLGDVRRGLAQVRDRLASFDHDGLTYWHARDETAPTGPGEPGGHLLQILDETYRGYQETRMVLDAAGVVPRGRETVLGMALVDGQLVARVTRTIGRRAVFTLAPYAGRLPAPARRALEQAAERYGAYLGLPHELVVQD